MNRISSLPYLAHSLPAAAASRGRLLARASAVMPSLSLPGHSVSRIGSACFARFNSSFQHGLQPFPFAFTPVHRSSNTTPPTTTPSPLLASPQQPRSQVETAQALAPELADELQLASALDTAAAVAASEAMTAAATTSAGTNNVATPPSTQLFDSPTAALDSAAEAAADSDTAPNLSWFVDPAATDMLPLWQRNLLASAADTAIAERAAAGSGSTAPSLDDLLLASDGKLTPAVLAEYLAQHGGQDVVVLDTAQRSDVTDTMVLATAASPAHMVSLASRLHAFIKEQITLAVDSPAEREAAVAAISVEGLDCDDWVLLDLGRVFVHVMTAQGRSEYDLDGLWGGQSMAAKGATDAWDVDQARSMPPGPVVFGDEPAADVQLRL